MLHMKKVLIWGYGVSGKATEKLIKKFHADWDCCITAKENILHEKYIKEQDIGNFVFDKIILSPGVSLSPDIDQSIVQSDVDFAYQYIAKTVFIGITGSNGKTSVRNYLGSFLQSLGYRVFIGGNSGVPLAEGILSSSYYDFYICEISSYQLEHIKFLKPNLIIFTNIFYTHKERYASFEEYKKAKWNIFKNATEKTFVISEKEFSEQTHNFSIEDLDLNFSLDHLIGDHQEKNMKMVYLAAKCFLSFQDEVFFNFIQTLQPVEHRMEKMILGQYSIYNDSKSTNPKALQVAIESMKEPFDLIVGGKFSSQEDIEAIRSLIQNTLIQQTFVFGQIASYFEDYPLFFEKHHIFKSKIILFSPGAASLDGFKNYEERGNFFKIYIQSMLQGE